MIWTRSAGKRRKRETEAEHRIYSDNSTCKFSDCDTCIRPGCEDRQRVDQPLDIIHCSEAVLIEE